MSQTATGPQSRLQRLLSYLQADPQNALLLADAAEAALAENDREQARELSARSLAAGAERADIRFRRSNLLMAIGDYEGAAELLQGLLAFEAKPHPALLYNLAYAQVYGGDAASALTTLQQIPQEQQAGLPEYQLLLARAHYYGGEELDQALASVDAYLESRPDDAEALALRAMLLLDLDRNDEASAVATKLLERNGSDVWAHLVLGSAAMEKQDSQVARQHLLEVTRAAPHMGRAWSALAFAELTDQNIELATKNFETAVETMPNHIGTWHGLAWSRLIVQDLAGARKAADAAMELDRNFAESHGILAILAILEGRSEEADIAIKRGLRLDPRSPTSLYARSLLISERGDPAASLRLVERIVSGAGLDNHAAVIQLLSGLKATGKGAPLPFLTTAKEGKPGKPHA